MTFLKLVWSYRFSKLSSGRCQRHHHAYCPGTQFPLKMNSCSISSIILDVWPMCDKCPKNKKPFKGLSNKSLWIDFMIDFMTFFNLFGKTHHKTHKPCRHVKEAPGISIYWASRLGTRRGFRWHWHCLFGHPKTCKQKPSLRQHSRTIAFGICCSLELKGWMVWIYHQFFNLTPPP